jgi:hypothetical protein
VNFLRTLNSLNTAKARLPGTAETFHGSAKESPMRITTGRTLMALTVTCACLLTTAFGVTGARANLASTTVKVTATGPARMVTPTLLGLNGVNTTGPQWDNSAFDSVLKKFAPGVIRYPGGTVANYWSWPDGWFQPGEWPGEPAKAVKDTLPVFGTGLAAAGATPLFDLNTVTINGAIGSDAENTTMLDQQLQALRSAAGDGLPVKMVELGNELYQSGYISTGPDGQDYAKRFPSAADYATQMNAWISALHSTFPGVKVAAVATDANDVPGIAPRRSTWNATMLPLLKGEDAVTIHDNLRVYDASSSPATVLAYPYLHFQKLKAHELALFQSDQLPVWVTEFNLADQTPGHVFQGTWLHGLFVAAQALLFTGDPDITYAGLDATIGTALAPIFSSTQGFGSGGPATVRLALSAAGTTMSMIQAAFDRASAAQVLSFTPSPALGTTGAPALLGQVLTTQGGPKLLLANLSLQPVTLDISAILPGALTVTQVTAPSIMTKVTGPGSTKTSTSTASGTVQIEPYALADISG